MVTCCLANSIPALIFSKLLLQVWNMHLVIHSHSILTFVYFERLSRASKKASENGLSGHSIKADVQ